MSYDSSFGFGLAWPVIRQGGSPLIAQGHIGLATFDSASAETISKIHAYLTDVEGSAALRLDVWDKAELPSNITTDTFRPNEDQSVETGSSNTVEDEGGNATPGLYQSIDEADLDKSDYIQFRENGQDAGPKYRMNFGSGAFSLPAGKRIEAIRMYVVVELATDNRKGALLVPAVRDGQTSGANTQTFLQGWTIAQDDGVVTFSWELKSRSDGSDWTEAEIQAFDSTNWLEVNLNGGPLSGESAVVLRIYQAWVEVDYASQPKATAFETVDADGWKVFDLDADWSKASGVTYALSLVKRNTSGNCVWPILDSDGDCPHFGWASLPDARSNAKARIESLGDAGTGTYPAILETSGAAASDESQPYATMAREDIYSGRTVEQEFTADRNDAIGWAEVVVSHHPETAEPLKVRLKKRSDDSEVGTYTIEPDTLPDPQSPRKLQVSADTFDNVSEPPADRTIDLVQYYIECSSAAAEATPWEVSVLSMESPPLSAETIGFGGTTDVATVDGTEHTDRDAPIIVAEIPSQVADFAASAGTAQVSLSWTATALGASFDRYLIERDGDVIAEITDESVTSFVDTGALQGVAETWAIQVKDTDGVTGQRAEATATAGKASGTHRLTSLHDSTVDMSLRASTSGMTWKFNEERAITRQMGRDGARVQRATKGLGEELEISAVLQNADDRALFDGLLAARDADVPHLVLTTLWGRRMYCAVVVDQGNERQIATLGRATVRLIEVATTPTPVVIS